MNQQLLGNKPKDASSREKANQRWCKLIFINFHLPNSKVVLTKIYVAQINIVQSKKIIAG